jgi:hypothetical protein
MQDNGIPIEAVCELCGEPMPPDESMFKFHGYSGPCPKPPLPKTVPTSAELVQSWRSKATESREEAGRIRRTVKAATDAEERCNVRAEVWDQCANELEAAKT